MNQSKRKTIENIVYGNEPALDQESYTQTEFITIMNWYNYNSSHDDLKVYTIEYAKKHLPDASGKLADIPKTLFKGTLGSLCRMIMRGFPISDYITGKINSQIDELIAYANEREKNKVISIKPKNVTNDVDTYIDDVELYADNCISTGNFVKKDWKKYIIEFKIKKDVGQQVADHFSKLLSQLQESNEGYVLSKQNFEKYVGIISDIVTEFSSIHLSRTKRISVPKPVNKEKLVSKVKYLKEFTELNVRSLNPIDIIGAKYVLLYNTKAKTMQLITSQTELTIRGSTIYNIDPETSQSKIIRKIDTVARDFIARDIPYVLGSFRNIKTKCNAPTGAINEHTLILTVFSLNNNAICSHNFF